MAQETDDVTVSSGACLGSERADLFHTHGWAPRAVDQTEVSLRVRITAGLRSAYGSEHGGAVRRESGVECVADGLPHRQPGHDQRPIGMLWLPPTWTVPDAGSVGFWACSVVSIGRLAVGGCTPPS